MNILKTYRARSVLPTFGLLIALTSPAFAVERLLSIGNNAADASNSGEGITVNSGDTFLVDLAANRSYSCEGFATDVDSNFDWSTAVVGTTGAEEAVTATGAGNVVPIVAGETGGTTDNRIVLTPSTTDRFRITVANSKGGGEVVKIRCLATTLFGSFNTNTNDFNFLELTNRGNQPIVGTITATDFNGTVAINKVAFTVPAQRRVDIDIHTAVGENKFGTIVVTANAPLGTLMGAVSQYEVNSNSSNGFSLTTNIPLIPFVQFP